jgi:HPt (histidine-containing phosphotransfer) domain-containing protein
MSHKSTVVPLNQACFAVLSRDIGDDGVRSLTALFARETKARLSRIADEGIEAKTLSREVHTLKGAAGVACAQYLSWRAARLEARLARGGALRPSDIADLSDALDAWADALPMRLEGVHTSSFTPTNNNVAANRRRRTVSGSRAER